MCRLDHAMVQPYAFPSSFFRADDRCGVGKNLDSDVVREAFLWSLKNDVPLQGFTGDEAVTLKMQPELEVRLCALVHWFPAINVMQASLDQNNWFIM